MANVERNAMGEQVKLAGIVLAGGRSSRMGKNKALLHFRGRPLIEHVIDILKQTGVQDIFVSGNLPEYNSVQDDNPFGGPVQAIRSIMRHKAGYKKYLFVPVDMPLLTPDMLTVLLTQEKGGYFTGWPLPVCLTLPLGQSASASVQGYLDDLEVQPVDVPDRYASFMKNANTPQEWKEVLSAS